MTEERTISKEENSAEGQIISEAKLSVSDNSNIEVLESSPVHAIIIEDDDKNFEMRERQAPEIDMPPAPKQFVVPNAADFSPAVL